MPAIARDSTPSESSSAASPSAIAASVSNPAETFGADRARSISSSSLPVTLTTAWTSQTGAHGEPTGPRH